MNSVQLLYERFGIVSELDKLGRVVFSGVGRCLPVVSGDKAAWDEVRRLIVDVEQNGRKYLQRDERLILTGERQVLILYPSEVRNLLKSDSGLYIRALKRGKSLRRLVASERRRNG